MPQSAVTAARPPSVTTRISGQPGPVERSSWHSDRTCGRSRRPSTRMTSAPGVSTRAGPSAGATRTLCSSRPRAGSTSVDGCRALVSSRRELMPGHLPGSVGGARFAGPSGPSRRFLLGPVEDFRGTASYVVRDVLCAAAVRSPRPEARTGTTVLGPFNVLKAQKDPGATLPGSSRQQNSPPAAGRPRLPAPPLLWFAPPLYPAYAPVSPVRRTCAGPPGRTGGAWRHTGPAGGRGHHGGRR